MIDLLGFAGSGLIIFSLTMKSIVRLRLVGLAGAVVFVSYGLWLGAWPVVATNLATSTINLVRLWGLRHHTGAGAVTGRSGATAPVPVNSGPSGR